MRWQWLWEWLAPTQEFGLYFKVVHMPLKLQGISSTKSNSLIHLSSEIAMRSVRQLVRLSSHFSKWVMLGVLFYLFIYLFLLEFSIHKWGWWIVSIHNDCNIFDLLRWYCAISENTNLNQIFNLNQTFIKKIWQMNG